MAGSKAMIGLIGGAGDGEGRGVWVVVGTKVVGTREDFEVVGIGSRWNGSSGGVRRGGRYCHLLSYLCYC